MKNPKYILQEASDEDLPEIAAFLGTFSSQTKREQWVRWKYMENPAGRARVFVVRDSTSRIKGALSFMPRFFLKPKRGAVLIMQAVDALLAPDVRGKGLYPKLLKYAMEVIGTPIYTFPNKMAERIEIQCGWRLLSSVGSWYFPVGIGYLISDRSLSFLSSILNRLSKIYAQLWLGNGVNGVSLRFVEKFEQDFIPNTGKVWGERSSAFLNWRFIDNPLKAFSCYEFVLEGDIIGYCVLDVDGQSAELYDFVALRQRRMCIGKLVEYCHEKAITHVLFRNIGLKLWNFGFVRLRSRSNVMEYNLSHEPWVMTFCDCDWDK